jgi:hypothetical protein
VSVSLKARTAMGLKVRIEAGGVSVGKQKDTCLSCLPYCLRVTSLYTCCMLHPASSGFLGVGNAALWVVTSTTRRPLPVLALLMPTAPRLRAYYVAITVTERPKKYRSEDYSIFVYWIAAVSFDARSMYSEVTGRHEMLTGQQIPG